ncbi:hypothetical protein [Actinomadura sp. SCN-SB]|uniref:hypothetical protein n=1 Tax=Actinomadura sp. SCN-SB TaxID=3373092 RepID=UPI003750DCF0
MPATNGESATADDRMLGSVPGAPALGRAPVNQEDGGFDCPGCAWPDDSHGLHLDICENGVKHANVLCGLADFSEQSGQPVTEHLIADVSPSRQDQATAR